MSIRFLLYFASVCPIYFGMFRVGFGYDYHRLKEGRALMLGGVNVPYEKGEDGHSDGDVLLHAITDALLGAEGKIDLGALFPPSDDSLKNAPSSRLLSIAWKRITENGWRLENIDCVVIMEKPKLNPYREVIIASIANILSVDEERVFVKFKTHEGVGELGNSNAIASMATALISKEKLE